MRHRASIILAVITTFSLLFVMCRCDSSTIDTDFKLCRILTPRNIRADDLYLGYSNKDDALYAYLSRTVRQIPSAALVPGGTIFKYETTLENVIPDNVPDSLKDKFKKVKRTKTKWVTIGTAKEKELSKRYKPTVLFNTEANSFLVMGGKDHNGAVLPDMWSFNIDTGLWTELNRKFVPYTETILSVNSYNDTAIILTAQHTYLYNITNEGWSILAKNPANMTEQDEFYSVAYCVTEDLFYLLDSDSKRLYFTSPQFGNQSWVKILDYSMDEDSDDLFPGLNPNLYWDPEYNTLGVMNNKALLFNTSSHQFSELSRVKLLFVQKMNPGGYDSKRNHIYFSTSVRSEISGVAIMRRQKEQTCADAYTNVEPKVFRYTGIASVSVAGGILVFAVIVILTVLIRQQKINRTNSRASMSDLVKLEHTKFNLFTNPNVLITFLSLYYNVIIFSAQYIVIFIPCFLLLKVYSQDNLVEFFFDSIGVLIDSKKPEISALIYLCTIFLIPVHTTVYYFLLSAFFYKGSEKDLANEDQRFYDNWSSQPTFNIKLFIKCLLLAFPAIGATLVYVVYFFFVDYYLQTVPEIQGILSIVRNIILIGSNFILTQFGSLVFASIIPRGTEWYELFSSVYQGEVSTYTYFVNILIVKIVLGFLGYMDYMTLRSIVIDINLGIVVSFVLSELLLWTKCFLGVLQNRIGSNPSGLLSKLISKVLTLILSEHYEWTAQWYSYLYSSKIAMIFCVLSPVILIIASLCMIVTSVSLGFRIVMFPPKKVYSPAIATATIRIQLHTLHPMRMIIYALLVLMVVILAPGRSDPSYFYVFLMIPLELCMGLSARTLNWMFYCCFARRYTTESPYFSEMMNLGFEPFFCGCKGIEGSCYEFTHCCTGRGSARSDIEMKTYRK